MNIFRVVIADDEPLARARLQRLLGRNGKIEIVGIAENGIEAIHLITKLKPDLVILDINMPERTGIEVAREIQGSVLRPPAVIFTTAYDEFALDAFNVNATDYLMKPIHDADLIKAIEKARSLNKLQALNFSNTEKRPSSLLLKRSAKIERVSVSEIAYFHAQDKLVIAGIHKCNDGNEEIIVDYALKDLEQKLSPAFCRIHRNTLVNTAYLEKMERNDDGHYVLSLDSVVKGFDVSRRQVPVVKSHFENI